MLAMLEGTPAEREQPLAAAVRGAERALALGL